jgi:hypothetical protein
MGLLRRVENRIEGTFEGMFRRSSKMHVEPPELAAKLVKEMGGTKRPSLSRTYVANVYTVYLCPQDRDHLLPIESGLRGELREHLEAHAREAGYALVAAPSVTFETDSDLKRGRFGIRAELWEAIPGDVPSAVTEPAPGAADPSMPSWIAGRVQGAPTAATATVQASGAVDGVAAHAAPATSAASAVESDAGPVAQATDGGPPAPADEGPWMPVVPGLREPVQRFPGSAESGEPAPAPRPSETQSIPADMARDLGLARQVIILKNGSKKREFHKTRIVLGRSRECDYPLDDPNTSRRHAVLYWETGTPFVKDLDSTNGTLLNGRPVTSAQLADGDVLTLGGTKINVELG